MIRKSFGAARLRQVRRAFESGLTPVPLLAKGLGISPSTFRKLCREQGWDRQNSPMGEAASEAAPAPPVTLASLETVDSVDTLALARRVEAVLQREIAVVEHVLATSQAPLQERDVRVFASLVKTIVELRRLEAEPTAKRRKGGQDGQDRPPRDMAALRADLVAKLERLRTGSARRSNAE
jgi:hypothetical protein